MRMGHEVFVESVEEIEVADHGQESGRALMCPLSGKEPEIGGAPE